MFHYKGVKEFIMGNNGYFFQNKMSREKHLYVTCSDDCRYAHVLNASLYVCQDVFSLLKLYSSVLTAEALSFVNMDEQESSIYKTHVYVLVKDYITDIN